MDDILNDLVLDWPQTYIHRNKIYINTFNTTILLIIFNLKVLQIIPIYKINFFILFVISSSLVEYSGKARIKYHKLMEVTILHIPHVLPSWIHPYPFSPHLLPQLFFILHPTPLLYPTITTA